MDLREYQDAITFQILGFNVEKSSSQKTSLVDDNPGDHPTSIPVRFACGVKVAVQCSAEHWLVFSVLHDSQS